MGVEVGINVSYGLEYDVEFGFRWVLEQVFVDRAFGIINEL